MDLGERGDRLSVLPDIQPVEQSLRKTNEWYEIDSVIKRNKRGRKDVFEVCWKGTAETS